MTMVPTPIPSLFKHKQYDGGCGGAGSLGVAACGDSCATSTGGSFGHLISRIAAAEYDYDDTCCEACVGSDLVGIRIGNNQMAEDESRTSSLNEAGSSSKGGGGGGVFHQKQEEEHRDEGSWLQLGIGGGGRTDPQLQDPLEPTGIRRPRMVELDLKPPGGGAARRGGGGGTSSAGAQQYTVNKALDPIFNMNEFRAPRPPGTTTPPPLPQPQPLFFLQYQHPIPQPRPATSLTRLSFPHHQPEVAWVYNRPNPNPPWTPSPSSPPPSSASPSSSMLPGSYYARLFQLPSVDVAGPSSSGSGSDILRVIDTPPRPHSGVWFVLQASQNQAKEPFLPQIPKSFLRIKDGRMTVLLLIKYLVNKLRLDSESEVEITCRGQQLLPFLTLQHVRDNIWSSSWRERDGVTLLPEEDSSATSATDHLVMILHYGRTA